MSREIGNGNNTTMTTLAAPLSEREYQSINIQYNESTVPYPNDKTIVDLFEAQAERTPNQTA